MIIYIYIYILTTRMKKKKKKKKKHTTQHNTFTMFHTPPIDSRLARIIRCQQNMKANQVIMTHWT